MKVIINSKYFTITEKDKKIIKYLNKIWMEKINNSINDFIIYFQFDKNEFFSNEILYKKYFFPENEEHKPKKIEVSEIKWYSEEKNPTIKKKEKRIKKGKKHLLKISMKILILSFLFLKILNVIISLKMKLFSLLMIYLLIN